MKAKAQYAKALGATAALIAASACSFFLLAAAIGLQDDGPETERLGRTSVLEITLPKPGKAARHERRSRHGKFAQNHPEAARER